MYRWADPDFLMTGGAGCDGGQKALMIPGDRCPGQTDDEYRTEVSLWAISSAPMIVASDVRNMSKLQQELLLNAEIIAVNQDSEASTTHGRLQNVSSSTQQVWMKTLSNGSFAVALYNSGATPQDIAIEFEDLGLADVVYKLRDL